MNAGRGTCCRALFFALVLANDFYEHAVVEGRYRATRRMADFVRAGASGERGDSALTVFRRSGFATLDKIRIMTKRA